MSRFVVPAATSIVVGLLLGAAAVFGVTLMVQQDTKPAVSAGDPASSVLNRVEYGNRS
jgi:tetrahydrodipicolinate N-succinyltransferase